MTLALLIAGFLPGSIPARAVALAATTPAAGSTTNETELDLLTNNLPLIPESGSLWTESMLWDKDIVLRAGLGYRDNVLLSPSAPQGRAFFTSGLDLTLFRVPLDRWEFNFSVTGDDMRYFQPAAGVAGEDLFLATAQLQKYFGGRWRAGFEVRGVYADQVLQEIVETGGVLAVQANGEMLTARPFIRRDFEGNWWLQVEAPLSREWWQSPLDDYWRLGGQVSLGLSYQSRSQSTLTAGAFYLPHDDWLARDATGAQLPGKRLAIWRELIEFKSEHELDEAKHWTTTMKFSFTHDHDNGGGFFDYSRSSVADELRFRTTNWDIKGAVGASFYDFSVQTADAPSNPKLHLTTLSVNLRVERRLYKLIRLYGLFEYEESLSNDPASQYKNAVGAGGISWEF